MYADCRQCYGGSVVARPMLNVLSGAARLPNRRLEEISLAVGKSRTELKYRMQFATEYPTEDELAHAVGQFKSWHEYRTQPRTERDPTETPPIPDGVFGTITAVGVGQRAEYRTGISV